MNLGDRFFLNHFAGIEEVGRYEIGVRIASAMVLLITAFRTAWPAFAYSIEDETEAKRTYAYVLTYLVALASWLALALGLLSPWLVRLLATPDYYEGGRVVALLAFGGVAYAAYIVMAIGVGRAKKTQFNWVITGAAALVSVALNLALVPDYGMMGSAVAAAAAYTAMFLGMTWYAQRVYPAPYQWRRVLTAAGVAVALTVGRQAARRPARRSDRTRRRLPARAAPARLLPAGGAALAQPASSPVTYMIAIPARKPPIA